MTSPLPQHNYKATYTLQTWFNMDRLKVAPTKSTITLLINYTKEHKHTPQLTLDNTAIPHKYSRKILGVTYDTSLSFKDHIHDIKQKCTHRLNMLRSITGTDFGKQKEIMTLIYKQYIRSDLEYVSPAWAPHLAKTHHNPLRTIQNNTMNHHWLYTNHTNKPPTLRNTGTHITRPY